ncbi:hypothetical protein AZE42_10898 [Rhizopogon vesiculosus]|uniref:Uncharacterized protein n=1 Tax=Rhizopogon vesiculosus TaxID=180088 RepID=A0A1J8R5N7_9AGAM|nr:hypothetical protein AZE42_10898 [Rhizopogon vesiculosus]
MWDEYDEGTAFMPVVSSSKELPVHPQFDFLALDADGHSLPSDWYMRIAGFTAEALRGERVLHETFPIKELQDYWATRPRYEDEAIQEEEEAKQAQRAYENWATKQGGSSTDEVPPPPYSLEAEQHTQSPQEATRPPQASSALNIRPIPPAATKPILGLSSSASVSSASPPSLPARAPSLTAGMSSASSPPPAVNMSSRPAPSLVSTRPVYPPDKMEVVMRPQHFHQRPGSSHSFVRPSSRVSSPQAVPMPSSPAISYLADDLSRQTLSQPSSEVVSGPHQSHVPGSSPIYSSGIQMPSVEASLRGPSTSPRPMPSVSPCPLASPAPVASWSQYPGHQQLHQSPYGPASHPHASISESRPSPTIGPVYGRYDANMQQHGHSYFPRVEQYHPERQWSPHTSPNSSAPQGPYMTMDNPTHPYPAPYPPVQDYYQYQIPPTQPQPQPGGSHPPRPYPPPEWGIQSTPPPTLPRPPIYPQSSSYHVPNPNGGDGGSGSGVVLMERALDTLESIAGRDARKQLKTLAKSKSAFECHSIIPLLIDFSAGGSKLLNKFK